MKIIIFGTSLFYQKNKENDDLQGKEILCFFDNNPNVIGTILDGKKIYAPNKVKDLVYDKIYIMSSFVLQMQKQLYELGVPEDKIYVYPIGGTDYHKWFIKHRHTAEELQIQSQRSLEFSYKPQISIVVPTYNTSERFLCEMIESVLQQTYKNWELCIGDGSDNNSTRELLKEYEIKDKRIKVSYLHENKGISENTNAAIRMMQGEYAAFLDHDDILTPDALYHVVAHLQKNRDAEFIYSDEDKMSEEGDAFFDPLFKPDYSPDWLRSFHYITHFMVISKTLINRIGLFSSEYDGAQDYEFTLRATKQAKEVAHIPQILYHWRVNALSMAQDLDNKPYALEAAKKAINRFLQGMCPRGETLEKVGHCSFQIKYELLEKPKVSIILPVAAITSVAWNRFKNLIDSLSYQNIELIIAAEKIEFESEVSNVKVVETPYESKTKKLAKAVELSDGKYLIFLEENIVSVNTDIVEQLLMHCQKSENGIVGGRIQNGDTILCAGFIVDPDCHKGYTRIEEDALYFGRRDVARNLSAVSGNGLMISRDDLMQIGGIDENFSSSYWDIDLCLRMLELKKYVVYSPLAQINTVDDWKNFTEADFTLFSDKWYAGKQPRRTEDPFYNPHLDRNKIGMLKK